MRRNQKWKRTEISNEDVRSLKGLRYLVRNTMRRITVAQKNITR